MRTCVLGVLPLLMVGCRQNVAETFVLHVEDQGKSVPGIRVFVDGVDVGVSNSRGEVQVGLQGRVKVDVALSPVESASPYLSKKAILEFRPTFFPKEEQRPVKLTRIEALVSGDAPTQPVEVMATEMPLPDVSQERKSIRESEIPPEDVATRKVSTTPLASALATPRAWPTLGPLASSPIPTPAGESKGSEMQPMDVLVRQPAGPVVGAQVFAIEAATRVPALLGVTGEDGHLWASRPRALRAEVLLVRHECCRSALVPALPRVEVALEGSKGVEFALQHEAYGVARALPGTEVLGASGRADVAGLTGIAAISWDALKGNKFEMVNKDALPERISGEAKPQEMVIRFVGLKKAPLPSVGFAEEASKEALPWRKFRREFFARFVQNQGFRAVVPGDVDTFAAVAGLSPLAMLRKGWQFTLINPELDFLLGVAYRPETESVELELGDRTGRAVFRAKENLGSRPEHMGTQLFERLLTAFPFEGSVLRTEGKEGVVNLGSKLHSMSVGQRLEVFGASQASLPPRESLGWARVKGVSDETCRVEFEGGGRLFSSGMRLRRADQTVVATVPKSGGI